MKKFQSINPFNNELLNEFEVYDDEKINLSLQRSQKAFHHWKNTSFQERSDLLINLAKALRINQEKYAMNISLEMGKILKEARVEVEKCAACCIYYAEQGEKILQDLKIQTEAKKSVIAFDPIGVVFAVMPWNFPFWQVMRFAVPTLMAGNVGLLKHAKNVSQCALHIEEAFIEAGFPKYVFQSLIMESSKTELVIAHQIVQGVTLTGSELAGSAVAAIAGKHIKKSVMELGGSDPFIVFEDADISLAAKIATQSRMQNAGQSCIAAKRFIVAEKIKDAFIDSFKNEVEKIKQGNQLDENNSMGPVCSVKSADELELQQNKSIANGAIIITGANRNGANYLPTILSQIKSGMPAYDEELFGPIASVISAANTDDMISIANSHRYGLAATIFTNDLEFAYRISRKIDAGAVFINAMVKSDPRLPFGGIKKSGYGRELSDYGMKEFTNVKTIYMNAD